VAIADGEVFIADLTENFGPSAGKVFDLHGQVGCSGVPSTCVPLRTLTGASGTPLVANGVVYIGTRAFDATGTVLCTGTPTVCSPLRQSVGSARAVVNGRLHGVAVDGTNRALVTERAPG
jgi:hypothetical protein